MKQGLKKLVYALAKTPLCGLLRGAWNGLVWLEYQLMQVWWRCKGAKMPTPEEQEIMRRQVTFIFKSFQRQPLAKRLYRNIQRYYPGVRVIIADDSEKPLRLTGSGLQVIYLPYDSGLSAGLNSALARVETPYVIRMDDDELLTLRTNFHRQLAFLMAHPQVDLVGALPMSFPVKKGWRTQSLKNYARFSMANAPKALKIPHNTWLDERHVVLGKIPNIFIARTEVYRSVGYDENIHKIDHHEFFYRAAGNLVAALDTESFVAHDHCPFEPAYQQHRYDITEDRRYIAAKHPGYFSSAKK